MRPHSIHLRFDAPSHLPEERVRAWREALGFSHDTVVRLEDAAAFEARFDGHHLARKIHAVCPSDVALAPDRRPSMGRPGRRTGT